MRAQIGQVAQEGGVEPRARGRDGAASSRGEQEPEYPLTRGAGVIGGSSGSPEPSSRRPMGLRYRWCVPRARLRDTAVRKDFRMTARSLRMAFVMDPIGGRHPHRHDLRADARGAAARPSASSTSSRPDLCVSTAARSRACPVTLRREAGKHVDLGEQTLVARPRRSTWSSSARIRPVDTDYVTATQILGLCRRCLVLNRPASVIAYNEKL